MNYYWFFFVKVSHLETSTLSFILSNICFKILEKFELSSSISAVKILIYSSFLKRRSFFNLSWFDFSISNSLRLWIYPSITSFKLEVFSSILFYICLNWFVWSIFIENFLFWYSSSSFVKSIFYFFRVLIICKTFSLLRLCSINDYSRHWTCF